MPFNPTAGVRKARCAPAGFASALKMKHGDIEVPLDDAPGKEPRRQR